MDDTGPKSECVNCALLVNSVGERNMVDMALVTTFLIPGVFFLGIALRWWFLLLCKWGREAQGRALQAAGLPAVPPSSHRPLPWEGVTKIFLTIIAASMTLGLPSHGSEILLLLSLYLFFLLSGLVDVVVFYCGYSILPEGIQSFILTLAFAMEAVIYHAISPTSAHHLVLLLFVILACALASILEVIFENKLVKFCRTFFTMLQATWLIHLGLLPSSTPPPTRAALLFSWHIASLFSVHLLTLLVYSQCKSSPRVPAKSLPSPSESASQLVPCKFLALPPGSCPGPPSSPTQSMPSNSVMSAMSSAMSSSVTSASVIDMEPWDRLQYSTFHKPV